MIEIIKEGNLPKKYSQCSKCNCEFTYTDGDMQHELKWHELGHTERWWVKCPDCGHEYDPEYASHHQRGTSDSLVSLLAKIITVIAGIIGVVVLIANFK